MERLNTKTVADTLAVASRAAFHVGVLDGLSSAVDVANPNCQTLELHRRQPVRHLHSSLEPATISVCHATPRVPVLKLQEGKVLLADLRRTPPVMVSRSEVQSQLATTCTATRHSAPEFGGTSPATDAASNVPH